MRKSRLFTMLIVATVFLLSLPMYALAGWDDPTKPGWKDGEAKRGWIQSKIENMTLEEKIGQLFIVHVYGKNPTDENYENVNISQNRGGKNFKDVIEKYKIGGVIYFNWTQNIGTPLDATQVNDLSNGLQDIAMDQRMPIPLFVSTDQEGGIVQRVTTPGTVFPGNMALGATRSTEYASKSAGVLGTELKSLGINMNFAPVADVNMNPANPVIGVRSFGEDPQLVSDMTVAQVNAYQDQNVSATAKHFPGHGDTDVDSHYGLPQINHDLETLNNIDLKPFKAAIDAGIDSIMTAHIVVPAFDNSGLPATLSKPILTGVLREQLGFDGLIITDSLGMSGANVMEPERVPVEAFKAGADILLNPPDVDLAYNAMLEAVKNGEVSEKRLDESVYRILKVKMKRGLFEDPFTDASATQSIGTEENLALAQEIANKSITLVKNENNVLPINDESQNLLVTGPSSAKPTLLSDLLNNEGLKSTSYKTNTWPTDAQINAAVEQSQGADKIIVTTYSANTNNSQQKLVNALLDTGKPVIVSAIRNPYDLMVFPEVDSYLATYGYQDVSIEALSRVVTGEVNPSGKLPVTIPNLYDFGYGKSY
ncbi:glycoside hydrolase family 3 protein [Aquibacillus sp. 3ASR75-11]|uniref:beta-N-acetylhexosaminidase n=1 Tax=Terrihalobacillus insolitus TaxID=2950438 RepID=A0A9X4ALU7_9BACI|nr:glycoside hydrolase family 3 protein [Terrihalobacillus insolitus]MDC3414044.1 glycoside hydrolase family 3 protein [Terrihalobacillus insolitus]MDC3424134.1 glycoside hydrolase family 3 protein [Terrihalobacillus insolitus]